MSPVEQAERILGAEFLDALEAHLLHGYVISTPFAFLMGRPVPKGADITDPWQSWPLWECDAWFVWVGVGDAGQLLDLAPYDLPWIGWYRQGRRWEDIHWRRTADVRAALNCSMNRSKNSCLSVEKA